MKPGSHHSEETRKQMSESHSGEKNANYMGATVTVEWRRKQSESHAGKKLNISEEGRKIHSESAKLRVGKNNGQFGKHPTEETRIKLSLGHTPEWREAQSMRMCGINNPGYIDGASHEPYCSKFNSRFKIRVRAFFKYICARCEKTTEENGQELSVHHVNFDKQTCCKDGEKVVDQKFVALCRSCHSYATNHYEWAIDYYTRIVNDKYGGKSYFTTEEMKNKRGII